MLGSVITLLMFRACFTKYFPISFYAYPLLCKFRIKNSIQKGKTLAISLKRLTLGWRNGSAVNKYLFLQGSVSSTHTMAHNIQYLFLTFLATKYMYVTHTFKQEKQSYTLKNISKETINIYTYNTPLKVYK